MIKLKKSYSFTKCLDIAYNTRQFTHKALCKARDDLWTIAEDDKNPDQKHAQKARDMITKALLKRIA